MLAIWCQAPDHSTVSFQNGVVVWTGEYDKKTISVDANLFENGAKQLRFRLKTDQCGLSLKEKHIPINANKFW